MIVSLETALAVALFSFVSSITPGPNNTMLIASGANHGFKKTIPHMLGINIGFPAMLIALGLGLGQVFKVVPVAYQVLQVVSALYLIYLAWQIAKSSPPQQGQEVAKPMTFLQAAGFQWVNPKAWIIAVGAVATYIPSKAPFELIVQISIVYLLINLPCIAVWAGFGAVIAKLFKSPRHYRILNIALAITLVLSLYPMLMPQR